MQRKFQDMPECVYHCVSIHLFYDYQVAHKQKVDIAKSFNVIETDLLNKYMILCDLKYNSRQKL